MQIFKYLAPHLTYMKIVLLFTVLLVLAGCTSPETTLQFSDDNIILDLQKSVVPFDSNLSISPNLIFYTASKNDSTDFFISMVMIDFRDLQVKTFDSFTPENIAKMHARQDADTYLDAGFCQPHHTLKISDSKYYAFTYGACGFFYEFDLNNNQMRVINQDVMGLDNVKTIGDTFFEENGRIYLSILHDDGLLRWYNASTDFSDIQLLYKLTPDKNWAEYHHTTRFYDGLIINSNFNSGRFHIPEKNVTVSNVKELRQFLIKDLNLSGDFNPLDTLIQNYEYESLSGVLNVINLKDKSTTDYDTSVNNPGHLELFEDKIYVSNHNFLGSGEATPHYYFMGPASIDRFAVEDGILVLQDTFQIPNGFRYTSHKVSRYGNLTYIATFAYPNRLLIINADTMELYRYRDVGRPYLEEIKNLEDKELLNYFNHEYGFSNNDNILAVEAVGEYIIFITYQGTAYVYSIPEDEILLDIDYLAGGYRLDTCHMNLV